MYKDFVFRCDGSIIAAPSLWEGERTPNINGEERFLRGGFDKVQLNIEDDSLQAHTHAAHDTGSNLITYSFNIVNMKYLKQKKNLSFPPIHFK